MPTYNILKIYNKPIQLEIVSQKDRFSQEFVNYLSFLIYRSILFLMYQLNIVKYNFILFGSI